MGVKRRKGDPVKHATAMHEEGRTDAAHGSIFPRSVVSAGIAILAFCAVAWFGLTRQHASSDLQAQPQLTDDWPVPTDLRVQLSCNLFCIRNTTTHHEMLAKLIKDRREAAGESIKESWPVFVEDACIEKCLMDHKKDRMRLGESYVTLTDLPEEIRGYISCARSCRDEFVKIAQGSMPSPAEAAALLRRCGVVHVPVNSDLVQSMRAGYLSLQPSGTHAGLVDRKQPPLRSGRQELWVPYEPPFTRFHEFLMDPQVSNVISHFFNKSGVVVDHVNVVNAPGGGIASRQDLHSDIGTPSEHLEFHIPLTGANAVPLEQGPTRFCPCSHGRVDLRDPFARTIRRYFGGAAHCLDFEQLSWTLHLGNTQGSQLLATMYDADVYHQGLENVASTDRPVMVIALTKSIAAVRNRNYVKRNISQAHSDAVASFRYADVAKLVQNAFRMSE